MRIERILSCAAAPLFDEPPIEEATERLFAQPGHHLLSAYAAEEAPFTLLSGNSIDGLADV
jgi:hypothetical protein